MPQGRAHRSYVRHVIRQLRCNCPDDYMRGHPVPNDVLLLIEVSDSSITYDQSIKLALYAEYRIANYWIFNLLDTVLECYQRPYQNLQGEWAYRSKQVYLSTDTVAFTGLPFSDSLQMSKLDLEKVFPPQR